ncbi:unnamed protein product [Adineta ricciae]|uniref:Uncharacterized protein n=1 Tax=Adineta ricciae TaxID=249248 RepID=A0A816EQF2_ADIRI|nr:unnamed protein product [Adineta ricciae]CAF1650556.1 unnamed protein product [Adineta ricciae]
MLKPLMTSTAYHSRAFFIFTATPKIWLLAVRTVDMLKNFFTIMTSDTVARNSIGVFPRARFCASWAINMLILVVTTGTCNCFAGSVICFRPYMQFGTAWAVDGLVKFLTRVASIT